MAALDLQRAQTKIAAMAKVTMELRIHNPDYVPIGRSVAASGYGGVAEDNLDPILSEALRDLVKALEVDPAGTPTAGRVNIHTFLHQVKWSETWIDMLNKANIAVKDVLFRLGMMPDNPGADFRCFCQTHGPPNPSTEYFKEYIDGTVERVSKAEYQRVQSSRTPGRPLPIDLAVGKERLIDALLASAQERADWWGDQVAGKRLGQTLSEGDGKLKSRSGLAISDPEADGSNCAAVSGLATERRGMPGVREKYAPVASGDFIMALFQRMDVHKRQVVDAEDVYHALHQLGVGVSRYEAQRMIQCFLNERNAHLTMQQFDMMLRKSRFANKLLGGATGDAVASSTAGGAGMGGGTGSAAPPSSLAARSSPSASTLDEATLDLWSNALNKLLVLEQSGRGLNHPDCLRYILRQRRGADHLEIPLKVTLPRLLLVPPPPMPGGEHRPPWNGTLDLLFVLDGSLAMGGKMWRAMQRLALDCIRRFSYQDEGRVSCGFLQFEYDLLVEQAPSIYMEDVVSNLEHADLRKALSVRAKARQGDLDSGEEFLQMLAPPATVPQHSGASDGRNAFEHSQPARTKEMRVGLAMALQRALELLKEFDPKRNTHHFVRPAARHVVVLMTNNETLLHNSSGMEGFTLRYAV